MKALLVGAITLIATSAWAGDWHIETITDDDSAQSVTSATISDDDGYRIDIFRNRDQHVRWKLALPKSSFDRLVPNGTFILFRVDNGPSREMKVSDGQYLESDISNGIYGRGLLWHGKGRSPTRGPLRDVLDGRMLYIRFLIGGNSHVDRLFSLEGAPAVIAKAIGIEAAVDPDVQAFETERDQAVLSASNACLASQNMGGCMDALIACTKDTSKLTAKALHHCMEAGGFTFE